jgi:hypothetical protein
MTHEELAKLHHQRGGRSEHRLSLEGDKSQDRLVDLRAGSSSHPVLAGTEGVDDHSSTDGPRQETLAGILFQRRLINYNI